MDYTGIARTNYFGVKDANAFIAWTETLNGIRVERRGDLFALLTEEGWPSSRSTDDCDDEELDIVQEVIPHIADGVVAIFMEIGNEGLRYLVGIATAVNNRAETCQVTLDSIYKLAQDLPNTSVQVTRASY